MGRLPDPVAGFNIFEGNGLRFSTVLPEQQLPMKKLHGFRLPFRIIVSAALLLLIIGQTGCKKSETQPQLAENKAWLNLTSKSGNGSPVDQLVLDSTHETLVPINKKEGWPQTQSGPTAVGIRFIDAGQHFTLIVEGRVEHFREVYIVSFRLL